MNVSIDFNRGMNSLVYGIQDLIEPKYFLKRIDQYAGIIHGRLAGRCLAKWPRYRKRPGVK